MTQHHWPSWRYRRHEEGHIEKRIFQNASELMNAGEGWCASPADVDSHEALSAATGDPGGSDGHQGEEVASAPGELNFSGLDDEDLRDIAERAGVRIDRRWGRARLEAALRGA